MKKKSKNYNEIIYQLTIEDIQNVAEENFGRELTNAEIEKILDPIADRIPWYDAIYEAIKDKLEIKEQDDFD